MAAGHYSVRLQGASAPVQFLQVLPSNAAAPAGMVMQTFLSKCLGPLSRWEAVLGAAADAGYSAVHLTPLCALGDSGSAYSIQEHTRYGQSLQCADTQLCTQKLHEIFDGLRSRACSVISDFVPNHAAASAEWLLHCPSMTFNLHSAPWLTAAAVTDSTLQTVAEELSMHWHPSRGRMDAALATAGLPAWGAAAAMDTAARVECVARFVLDTAKQRCRPWEFFVLPASASVALKEGAPASVLGDRTPPPPTQRRCAEALAASITRTQGALHNPSASGVRFPICFGAALSSAWEGASHAMQSAAGGGLSAASLHEACVEAVSIVNVELFKAWDEDAAHMAQGVQAAAQQLWLRQQGGRGVLGGGQGLVPAYFKRAHSHGRPWRCGVMACNGFVWGGDVLEVPTYPRAAQPAVKAALAAAADRDALAAAGTSLPQPADGSSDTEAQSTPKHEAWPLGGAPPLSAASGTYLRRELVAWSDCVKLNYGFEVQWEAPLWRRMRSYAEDVADMFDGVRLDNCHGTPLFVSAALLRCMRRRRPALRVIAELFTGSADVDALFVSHLGISALVRELMQCHSTSSILSSVLGSCVGTSKLPLGAPSAWSDATNTVRAAFTLPVMLYDVTHDNEPAKARFGAWGVPAVAALASMAAGAVGSSWGVDQLKEEQLEVVHEHRLIPLPSSPPSAMLRVRGLLNALHRSMAARGLRECHAHSLQGAQHIIHIQRVNRRNGEAVHMLVALDAPIAAPTGGNAAVTVQGAVPAAAACARLSAAGTPPGTQDCIPIPDERGTCQLSPATQSWLHGALPWEGLFAAGAAHATQVDGLAFETTADSTHVTIDCSGFLPGSVAVFFAGWSPNPPAAPVHPLHAVVPGASPEQDRDETSAQLDASCEGLSADDLRFCLYLCEAEEREGSGGAHGCYAVPGHGTLPWAGLAGILPLLRSFLQQDGTGHAFAQHMRDGDWYLQFVAGRLGRRAGTRALGAALQTAAAALQGIPREAAPAVTCGILYSLWCALLRACCRVLHASPLLAALQTAAQGGGWSMAHPAHMQAFMWPAALQLMQHFFMLVGDSQSAPLLEGASLGEEGGPLAAPLPLASMAAGVPHFSCSYMRCWGRDTFIALRGLGMLTGQWRSAAAHLLAFACVVRHGLVPNLHNAGRNPRYNARDATWFWASAVVEYVELAPGGSRLLDVPLRHADGQPWSVRHALLQVLRLAHAGNSFREDGAGDQLDAHMTSEGFNVSWGVHAAPALADSGLRPGGNAANCGTWMDKMGSSSKWGNKGVPATPRCGAPVEITGLTYKVLRWAEAHLQHDAAQLPLGQWAAQLHASAEQLYFIPNESSCDATHLVRPELVSPLGRGYLRDVVGTAPGNSALGAAPELPPTWPLEFTEYQLRPNQLIALAEAPALWSAEVRRSAVAACARHLVQRRSMGVRTLAPFDWAFRGDYVNSDSSSRETADGWNYHQGPEWLWLWGVYWRARLAATPPASPSAALHALWTQATPHVQHLNSDAWGGLPELCNANNAPCPDSCEVQAWSAATLLDALWDSLQL